MKKYEADAAKLETFIDARWHRELQASTSLGLTRLQSPEKIVFVFVFRRCARNFMDVQTSERESLPENVFHTGCVGLLRSILEVHLEIAPF